MSMFKIALTLGVVAAASYVGYKAAKNPAKAKKVACAVADAMIRANAPAPRQTETVARTVTVRETVEVVTPDKSRMEGVMSTAKTVQDAPTRTVITLDEDDVAVNVTYRVGERMEKISLDDAEELFGGPRQSFH